LEATEARYVLATRSRNDNGLLRFR